MSVVAEAYLLLLLLQRAHLSHSPGLPVEA